MNQNNMTGGTYTRQRPRLALVVPCYNEEAVLPTAATALLDVLEDLNQRKKIAPNSFVCFVDDGSSDRTWSLIEELTSEHPRCVRGVKLAVNAGHQYALVAGLDCVSEIADASITIDADLQDDIRAIEAMLDQYYSGFEVVLGVREKRDSDTPFKRVSAGLFYKLLRIMGVRATEQHADFRLLSRAAMNNLGQFSEYHLYLRGFPELLHSRITTVSYARSPRVAGESKYPLRKMLSLAWSGITSFSIAPLRLIGLTGATVFLISSALALYAILARVGGDVVPGWASITAPLYALGGLLMLSMGVLGEYIGKIYLEVKRRPRYLIETVKSEDE